MKCVTTCTIALLLILLQINEIYSSDAKLVLEMMKDIKDEVQKIEFETARNCREIPRIGNDISSVKEDLTNYCKANTKKTQELLRSVRREVVQQRVNNSAEIRSLRSLVNSVGEEQSKSLEIVQKIHENANKIANIENILTDVSSKLENLVLINSNYTCKDFRKLHIFSNGVYKLYNGPEVYCDQTTDGGGWIVFQRRINGEVDFYRNWTEYKHGFGNLDGEFWLGNENLNLLTRSGGSELRIDMEDFEGNKAYAKYSKFKVHPEHDTYRLEVSGYSGNAGDGLEYHDGMSFSTFDQDNDRHSGNCAEEYIGAWWYKHCHYVDLNGKYESNVNVQKDRKVLTWYSLKNNEFYMKQVEMKLR